MVKELDVLKIISDRLESLHVHRRGRRTLRSQVAANIQPHASDQM